MSKRKKEERGRFTARRKVEAVMRLLKGEDLDTVSRELGATAATLSEWRDTFLSSAEAGLKSRELSAADEENLRLRAKVGELTMENELLREKAEKLEVNAPHFPWRKSRPSHAISPSAKHSYGLARVCRTWRASRATVYRHRLKDELRPVQARAKNALEGKSCLPSSARTWPPPSGWVNATGRCGSGCGT